MEKENFSTFDSLKQIEKVLKEAAKSLNYKSKTSISSEVKEIIGAAVGGGVGIGAGAAIVGGAAAAGTSGATAITSGLAAAGGVVGGGMMAGIFVAAAPVAVLGVAGYGIVSKYNKDRIQKQKEILLKDAVAKHNKIIKELKGKAEKSQERVDHLGYLNEALRRIIDQLETDLKKAS